jgi:hypothetical protein
VTANAASQTLKMMKKIIQIMIFLSLLATQDFSQTELAIARLVRQCPCLTAPVQSDLKTRLREVEASACASVLVQTSDLILCAVFAADSRNAGLGAPVSQ